ncbi:hypothetical protein F9B85_10690 [Heliorestis acidaminivorans]|uniref:DUF5658 domain-containing protein n=1 Tax=Heliorestis acidaminivorans TaxID=553427 RepID=A0A6I0EZD7_9FIRM|nr:DUF5658 family protein [Heliorestis acidaminivorans]KAB2952015.1 hypothetical protein F9B85_10690 [Heliorestis acidaminivorans]
MSIEKKKAHGLNTYVLSLYWRLFLPILLGMNMFDWGATTWGINKGYIEEANPLTVIMVEEHPFVALLLKVLFSFALGLLLPRLWYKEQKQWFMVLSMIVLGVYLLITVLHLYWLTLL